MPSDNLENLARIGELKREAGDEGERMGLLHSGRVRLRDARLARLSSESRFDPGCSAGHAYVLAMQGRVGNAVSSG